MTASRIAFPIVLVAGMGLAGCAGPSPVLYPNQHLEAVGRAEADRDIAECRELAQAAGARGELGEGAEMAGSTAVGGAAGAATGAVGGAVVGSPGRGAAVGAATGATGGLLRSIFGSRGPSGAHRAFVNRCLHERGYEPIGWD